MTSLRNPLVVGLLFGLIALLILVDLGGRDIWDIDEGMHAAIAQTMLLTGDWVTPVFGTEPFFDKPPMFNWMTAASFAIFGATEFAARLPAALSALGCVFLCYVMGRRLYSHTTGILAAIVLATAFEFIFLARTVQYEAPFTLFTTLAMCAYVLAVLENEQRRRYWILFHVGIGLATITKGPLGAVIVGLGVIAHVAITGRVELLKRIFDPVGLVVFVIIAVPWYVLMEQANPGYLNHFIFQQHVGNLLGGSGDMVARHPEPFYYYLPVLAIGLFPWSLVLPQSIYNSLKHREARGAGMDVFLVAFLVAPILMLSFATSKLSNYALPVFPAAALLVARYWDRVIRDLPGSRKTSLVLALGGIFLVLAATTTFAIVEKPWPDWKVRYGVEFVEFEAFMIVLTLLFLSATLLAFLVKHRANFGSLAMVSPFMFLYILWVVAPDTDPYRGSRLVAAEMDSMLPESETLYFYGRLLDSAMFYTNRNGVLLKTEEELRRHFASDERRFAVYRTRSGKWDNSPDVEYYVLKTIANKAIISNQPGPTPPLQ